MRRFFLFAVLWAALFGPGHVLAACPMAAASQPHHGSHAPCHSEGEPGAPTVDHGHDCCSLVAPSGSAGKFFAQKSDGPAGNGVTSQFAMLVLVGWTAPPLLRPPPLRVSRYPLRSATAGSDTFLRTGRLRL
jgi:hypothetical protein